MRFPITVGLSTGGGEAELFAKVAVNQCNFGNSALDSKSRVPNGFHRGEGRDESKAARTGSFVAQAGDGRGDIGRRSVGGRLTPPKGDCGSRPRPPGLSFRERAALPALAAPPPPEATQESADAFGANTASKQGHRNPFQFMGAL